MTAYESATATGVVGPHRVLFNSDPVHGPGFFDADVHGHKICILSKGKWCLVLAELDIALAGFDMWIPWA